MGRESRLRHGRKRPERVRADGGRSRCCGDAVLYAARSAAARRCGAASSPSARCQRGRSGDRGTSAAPGRHDLPRDQIGLLMLDGVISRELGRRRPGQRRAARPGRRDPRPWQIDNRGGLLPVGRVWTVLSPRPSPCSTAASPTELARWPEITSVLLERRTSARSAWPPPRRSPSSPAWTGGCRAASGTSPSAGAGSPARAWSCRCALTHRMLGAAGRRPAPHGLHRPRRARRPRRAHPPAATGRGCCAATRRTPRTLARRADAAAQRRGAAARRGA